MGNLKRFLRFFSSKTNDGTNLLVQLLFTVSNIVRGNPVVKGPCFPFEW